MNGRRILVKKVQEVQEDTKSGEWEMLERNKVVTRENAAKTGSSNNRQQGEHTAAVETNSSE